MQTNISTHTHSTKCLQWDMSDFILLVKCACITLWVKGQAVIDNDNDNDNILFDYNVQIEITIFNSLENQIINWFGDYY